MEREVHIMVRLIAVEKKGYFRENEIKISFFELNELVSAIIEWI